MKLRRLELKDAVFMIEWMHDVDVVKDLHTDFLSKTKADCEKFIKSSWKNKHKNLHMAIVDDYDEYQGTVSLKEVDSHDKTAEFAITIRSGAMGKGIASFAMHSILNYGNEEMGLKAIYWCVDNENTRAVRFYDKNGYKRVEKVPQIIKNRYVDCENLIWYLWKV